MSQVRYLYHGTSTANMAQILKEGLKPRSMTGRTQWSDFPSRDDMVYLTTAYPWYFAVNAALGKKNLDAAVYQIDLRCLAKQKMHPDEDWIAQSVAQTRNVPLDSVHDQVRRTIESYQEYWRMGLKAMGTVAHKGVIPADAIVQVVTFDMKKRPEIMLSITDPTITPINYMVKGWFYRQLVDWTFKQCDELPQVPEMEMNQKAGLNQEMCRQSLRLWRSESQRRDGFLIYPNEGYRSKKEVTVGKV